MPRRKRGQEKREYMRAVIYARVSSDRQEEDGTSLDTQEEDCQAYADSNGYLVVKTVREVWTGYELHERKKLSQVREMGRNGEFDVLIFRTYDRLTRNDEHLSVLLYESSHYGFRLESVKEVTDDTPIGRHIRHTYGLLGELERAKIIDRTQNGRKKRVQGGRLLPGTKARYGYRWGGKNKDYLTLCEEEVAVVREMFAYFTTVKTSTNGLTRMLNEKGYTSPSGKKAWNRSIVYDILTDPIYIGEAYAYRYDGHHLKPKEEWVRLPDEVTVPVYDENTGLAIEGKTETRKLAPAIIDRKVFELTQKLLQINKEESMRHNPWQPTELLRCGFVRCGYCNRFMVVNRYHRTLKNGTPDTVSVYACRHFYKDGNTPGCKKTPSITTERLDKAAWEYVGDLLSRFELVEKAIALAKGKRPYAADLASIDGSINGYKAQQESLIADLKKRMPDGSPYLIGTTRDLVLAELNDIEKHLANLALDREKVLSGQTDFVKMQAEIDDFIAWGRAFKDSYESASYEEKRRALRHFGIVVYVYRRDDEEHEQYEICVTIPDLSDIVSGGTRRPRCPS